MRVYLAAAMTSPHQDLPLLQALLSTLQTQKVSVLNPHVAYLQGKEHDAVLTDQELARRDMAWLEKAHCLVAEVSTPSHGVGIEVMAALGLGIPVLALARENALVSRLLRGLPGVQFRRYRDATEAKEILVRFLEVVKEPPC